MVKLSSAPVSLQCPWLIRFGSRRMKAHLMVLQQVARRTLTTTARRQVENKVPQKQKLFQADNGLPVHLKGGASDAVLYRATMGLTVMGTLFVLYELGKAALPQKKE